MLLWERAFRTNDELALVVPTDSVAIADFLRSYIATGYRAGERKLRASFPVAEQSVVGLAGQRKTKREAALIRVSPIFYGISSLHHHNKRNCILHPGVLIFSQGSRIL